MRAFTRKTTMKRPRKTVAEKTAAYAFSFPKHEHQDQLLASAIELRAIALGHATDDQMSGAALEQKAKAEFEAALQAIIFPPTENQFYCIWSRHPDAAYLAACVDQAWSSGKGKYGSLPPQHWHAKK